jgi:hypothetical protein
MPARSLSPALALALAIGACAGVPPPAAADEEPAGPVVGSLVQPGRVLHFRGRTSLSLSRADRPPAPQVGYALTRLRALEERSDGALVLEEESFLHSADGESLGQLANPRDRRTRRLVVDPAAGRLQAGPAISAPPPGPAGREREFEVRFTDDGLGLNAAARDAAGLATLLLDPETFRRLAAGEEIEREFDFWLVRDDPLADRVVMPVAGAPSEPDGAEGRVRGRTVLRPLGPETHPVDWRPTPPADGRPPRPDRRVELPALGVAASVRLEILRPDGPGGAYRTDIRRQDSLTWVVLDDPGAPWIVAWDGLVDWQRGAGAKAELREAYLSRTLFRVEASEAGEATPAP